MEIGRPDGTLKFVEARLLPCIYVMPFWTAIAALLAKGS